MKAMLLESLGDVEPPFDTASPVRTTLHSPLKLVQHPEPILAAGEVLIKVTRCGVCHTELDEIEGCTSPPRLPMILGHQVVGPLESDSKLSDSRGVNSEDQTRISGI